MNSRRISHHQRAAVLPGGRLAFTLMEVMLAIAVSAVVLVAISGVFFSALRLRSATLDVLDEALPIDRAMNVIMRDLRNAVPPGEFMAGPLQSGVTINGVSEGEGIQFYTTTGLMNDRAPWGELQKVSYMLRAPSNTVSEGQNLVRIITRNLLPLNTEDTEDQLLIGGVTSLQFFYFDGRNWLDVWNTGSVTNMPYAVRVHVQLAKHKSRDDHPVELVVPMLALGRTNYIEQMEGKEADEDED
jgi:type II secretion system protein J